MAESYCPVNSCCEAQQEETSLLWFQLGTCAHSLCALCFSSANATRCCSPYITCTLCKQESTVWSVVQHDTEIGTFAIEEPSLAKDPKQFHKLKWEEMQSSAVLAMTIPVDGGIKTIVAVLDEKKPTAEWDEIQIKNLLTIFGALNSYLIESDYDPGDDNLAMYVNPVEEAFAGDRVCSVLHRCIHAFATQEFIYDEPVFSTKWRSRRAATFAATDIIRCLKKSKEGKLKRFVGRQMIANGASQGLWKILSKFGLVTDMKKERRNAITTRGGKRVRTL